MISSKPKKDKEVSSPVKLKKEPKDKNAADSNTVPRKKINKRLKKLQILESGDPNSAASMREPPFSFDSLNDG